MIHLSIEGIVAKYEIFKDYRKKYQQSIKSKLTDKDKLRDTAFDLYKSGGLALAHKGISKWYSQTGKTLGKDKERLCEVRGELSEILLELQLYDYVKSHKGCCYIKNCCIPKEESNEEFTELDLALVTESCVIIFESKSYAGDKILEDQCILNGRDIVKQNILHRNQLHYYLGSCIKSKSVFKPYILALYSFSKGDLLDNRTSDNKKKFPLFTYETFDEQLRIIFNERKGVKMWDVNKCFAILKVIEEFSPCLFSLHIKNMKGRDKK